MFYPHLFEPSPPHSIHSLFCHFPTSAAPSPDLSHTTQSNLCCFLSGFFRGIYILKKKRVCMYVCMCVYIYIFIYIYAEPWTKRMPSLWLLCCSILNCVIVNEDHGLCSAGFCCAPEGFSFSTSLLPGMYLLLSAFVCLLSFLSMKEQLSLSPV